MIVNDLKTDKGIVRWRESGDPDAPMTVMWHHGTPGIGAPPGPLLATSEVLGIRWLAPFHAGEAELCTAVNGRDALHLLLEETDEDPELLTLEDHAVPKGEWRWFDSVGDAGTAEGLAGVMSDELAFVAEWGFDPAAVKVPTPSCSG